MSPRRNTPRRKGDRQRRTGGGDTPAPRTIGDERRETGPDGVWAVRDISGAASAKTYRCPGCAQEIRVGTPHVVAWRPETAGDDRRHWHSSCWARRAHRAPRPPRR